MSKIPLITAYEADKVIAMDRNQSWSQQQFLLAANTIASQLGDEENLINLCRNRYNFMLVFAAGLIRNKPTLLPPSSLKETIAGILREYPSTAIVTDAVDSSTALPARTVESLLEAEPTPIARDNVPALEASQVAAIAFTSGSTGVPRPHTKNWGTLAITAQLLGRRFMPERAGTIVATVPSQHMYGLEMTILMTLQSGATLYTGL